MEPTAINRNKRTVHYGYVVVGCCLLIMSCTVSLMMGYAGIFYEPVSASLGVSVGTFGLYLSVLHLASAVTLSFAGRLMERFSARWLLTASAAAVGVCFVLMSKFTRVWHFYVPGAVFGTALAFLLYLGFPTLINRWFNARVGFLVGLCSAASGIGGMAFNPFGAWLIGQFGWRAAYLAFGAIVLLAVTPAIALLLRDRPADKHLLPYGEAQAQAASSAHGVLYASARRMPVFYALVLFSFLLASATALYVFLPSYAMSLGYELAQGSLVVSALMGGSMIGKVALGVVNDRSNLLGIAVTVGFASAGLGLMLLGHLGPAVMLAAGFLFGWGHAAVTVESAMLVRRVFGSRDFAPIYAKIAMAISLANMVASGGWGLLADGIGYVPVLLLCIAAMLVLGAVGCYALSVAKTGGK